MISALVDCWRPFVKIVLILKRNFPSGDHKFWFVFRCDGKILLTLFGDHIFPCGEWKKKFQSPVGACLKKVNFWRLVFTGDGVVVVVGVVIRSLERYDLVKMKPTESEAEHWFRLRVRRLRSRENWIVGVWSGSGRIIQWCLSNCRHVVYGIVLGGPED